MKNRTTNLFLPAFLIGALLLFGCNADMAPSPNVPTGKGGSMARFAVSGDMLYTIDHNQLNLFNISNPKEPVKGEKVNLGFGIETIFPFQDKLFIGTTTGMRIIDIKEPAAPRQISNYEHVTSCDPVVTNGRYAFVTLRFGTICGAGNNSLQIVDLENMAAPFLLKQYNMTSPKGLGLDGNLLFVCDDGLKVYDATNVLDLKLKHHFKLNAFDVIPNNGLLLLIGADGFYQYTYDHQNISLLSKIAVEPAY